MLGSRALFHFYAYLLIYDCYSLSYCDHYGSSILYIDIWNGNPYNIILLGQDPFSYAWSIVIHMNFLEFLYFLG